MLYLTLILMGALLINGYPQFMEMIPNGKNVTDPCSKNKTWPGVGHLIAEGSGARNQFGLDFAANGMVWDKTLCKKDSDGDGRSNGEELGDPDCTWKINETAKITTNVSHPGICEPLSSHKCMEKNSWLKCNRSENFSCPAFDLPGTKTMNLTIPRTAIPQNETTYMCMGFKLPNDTRYHLIGQKSVIENSHMLHHMVLYGCNSPLNDSLLTKPETCSMGMVNCTTIIGLWGPGASGDCHPKEFGFPIGHSGFQYVVLQLHWNNPMHHSDEFDSSGMTIYYTSQLRPNDGMVFIAGQMYITIPPHQENVTVEGSCKKECSKLIKPTSVNISAAILHMHLLGKSAKLELIREGKQPILLAEEHAYDYNTPTRTNFENPIEFHDGDEIKVTCEYQSLNKSTVTRYGEGTQDEMCYAFLTIYPAVRDFDVCAQYQDLDMCSINRYDVYTSAGCDLESFSLLLGNISKICNSTCSEECKLKIQGLKTTNCWGDQLKAYIKEMWPQFVNASLAKVFEKIDNCSLVIVSNNTQLNSQTPLMGNNTHQVSQTPLMGNNTHQVSESPIMGNNTHQVSESPIMGNNTHQASKPPIMGNNTHQASESPIMGNNTHQVSHTPSAESDIGSVKLHSQRNTEALKSTAVVSTMKSPVSASKAEVSNTVTQQEEMHSNSPNPAVRLSSFRLIHLYSFACAIVIILRI